jgi:hypothetical protein
MYTDEPAPEKDVALGQNFSRFSLLTKITVFCLLRYPAGDISEDSHFQNGRQPSLESLHGKEFTGFSP